MINDTPMKKHENLSRRARRLAVKWPDIQRVVDAAINDTNGRGGRGRFVGDGSKHREQYERPGAPGPSGLARDHPRVSNLSGRPDDTAVHESSRCSLTGHLEPRCWLKYPHLRSDRQPAHPSANTYLPAQSGVHSTPIAPSRVEGEAPVGAGEGQAGYAFSARNSPAGNRGARPGWSDVGGTSAGSDSPGRLLRSSSDARKNPQVDRGTPA